MLLRRVASLTVSKTETHGHRDSLAERIGSLGTRHHGNAPHECNDCMIESDLALDGAREAAVAASRNDEPPVSA